MKKENEFSCFFGNDTISNGHIRPLKIILVKKTTEVVLLFHRNVTNLVFHWPNMSQKQLQSIKQYNNEIKEIFSREQYHILDAYAYVRKINNKF